MRARQEIRRSRGTHRKSSLFLWIIAQAGPSQYCPSACLSICLSFHLKMVLKPVWRYTSVPVGQAGLPVPRKLLIPLPDSLSLPTFPTEHLFKKKILRKKERKATTASGLQIQQAKYTASTGGKGPPPSLASQQPQSLIYIVHKSCALHNQNEAPLPRNNIVYSSMPPTRSREGTGQKGEEETETHEGVCVGNESRSLQRNLMKHLPALVRGEEKVLQVCQTSIHKGACVLSTFRRAAPQCGSLIRLPSSGPGQHLPVRAAWVSPRV